MCRAITLTKTEKIDMLEKSFLIDLATYIELSGTYILKIYGYAQSQQGENIRYMVITEYISRGSLCKVIQGNGNELSLRRRLDIARSIAGRMRKIHEHYIIFTSMKMMHPKLVIWVLHDSSIQFINRHKSAVTPICHLSTFMTLMMKHSISSHLV